LNICTLATFDGPNRFDPRPDVLAHLCAGRDYGATLRAALKDAVQRIGLVIGAPHIDSRIADGKVWHEAFFVTPMSVIGAGMLRYVVALLNVRDAGDEEWDTDGRLWDVLWDVQNKHRAEASPLQALQLIAEASAQRIPAFTRRDGLRSATAHAVMLLIRHCFTKAGRIRVHPMPAQARHPSRHRR
jgi:hypothetical protein